MTTTNPATGQSLHVGMLARVEGEGGMDIRIRDGVVESVALNIFEPPRFYEAFLRGRRWTEPPDITARICGICPVAYQSAACAALESICGVAVPDHVRLMRRLLYCGEWIESHTLHVYLLHAPDFLGYDGAIEMAGDHPAVVERALRLKKAGNDLMALVGGRAVHPVNVKVGGFYRLPTWDEISAFRPTLQRAFEDALETVRLVATFDFPDFEQDVDYLALRSRHGYSIESGDPVTTGGLSFPVADFPRHISEHHVAHSNALHAVLDGKPYLVGPLARYLVAYASGRKDIKEQVDGALKALDVPITALFSTLGRTAARGLECQWAAHKMKQYYDELIANIKAGDLTTANVEKWEPSTWPTEAKGAGPCEAPRGALAHWIKIKNTRIDLYQCVVPTTWNAGPRDAKGQIGAYEAALLNTPMAKPEQPVEILRTIHSFDPCLACATHVMSPEGEELVAVTVR